MNVQHHLDVDGILQLHLADVGGKALDEMQLLFVDAAQHDIGVSYIYS